MQVIVNLHSARVDPDDWHQPQQFRSERFLDQSGNVVDRDRVIVFSLGTYASTHIAISYSHHIVTNPILLVVFQVNLVSQFFHNFFVMRFFRRTSEDNCPVTLVLLYQS